MFGRLCEVERAPYAPSEPSDACQDLVGGLGPDEGGATVVVRRDELVNGGCEGADAPMHAASQLLRGQLGEPALNEVEPGRVGRGEVDVEPRPLGEPGPDERRLVGPVRCR